LSAQPRASAGRVPALDHRELEYEALIEKHVREIGRPPIGTEARDPNGRALSPKPHITTVDRRCDAVEL
jgi:hypothetical protein